ncbi:MAG: LPS assembly lipoprotein LptE [bacterium]
MFRVHDGKNHEFVPVTRLQIQRDIAFNESQVLAREAEEVLIYRDMQSDLVQQVLRRLAAARPVGAT